uniref:Uncharacterized protein n=1 Tax=Physcomitrium patens TaxID=3218 RepID=A9SJ23_PHYPA|nr:hypothetical protein PHYPA_002403 [Physcomitrium patens]
MNRKPGPRSLPGVKATSGRWCDSAWKDCPSSQALKVRQKLSFFFLLFPVLKGKRWLNPVIYDPGSALRNAESSWMPQRRRKTSTTVPHGKICDLLILLLADRNPKQNRLGGLLNHHTGQRMAPQR